MSVGDLFGRQSVVAGEGTEKEREGAKAGQKRGSQDAGPGFSV